MTRVTKEGKGWWLMEVYENGMKVLEIHQKGKPRRQDVEAAERQAASGLKEVEP